MRPEKPKHSLEEPDDRACLKCRGFGFVGLSLGGCVTPENVCFCEIGAKLHPTLHAEAIRRRGAK